MKQKMYVLFVSEKCNLSCAYCEHQHKNVVMSKETFLDILDEAMEQTEHGDMIGFSLFGGEPLTNYELVKFILETAERLQDKRNIVVEMVTNLTLLNDEMLETFRRYKEFFKIGISIDGNKEVHDPERQGTLDIVLANAQKVKDAGLDFGAAMVIDRKHLDKTFDNVQYLYDVGFRNFSMFVNWNDLEFLSSKNYALKLKAEIKKVLEFVLKCPDIGRFKIEKADLRSPQWDSNSTCEIPVLEYVGCTGRKFNCTRWKYAKGESMAVHEKGKKCDGCEYAAFCCSCLGNDSFFYEGIKRRKTYQTNYCFTVKCIMDEIFAYWDEAARRSPQESVATYVLNDEQHLLIRDPKIVDTTDQVVFVGVRKPQELGIKGSPHINAIVILNRHNVDQLCDIVDACKEQGVRHFAIRVSDIEKWTTAELDEYRAQLEMLSKIAYEEGLVLEYLVDILSGASRVCDEMYRYDGKAYFDVDFRDEYDESLIECVVNSPLCSECMFAHCIRNPGLNKRSTGEASIPPYQLCEKSLIETEVAVNFFDEYVDSRQEIEKDGCLYGNRQGV